MDDDWDLNAVVRGCAAASSTTPASAFSSLPPPPTSPPHQGDCSFSTACFLDPFEVKRESLVQELHDLCKPYFPNSRDPQQIHFSPQKLPISPLSDLQDRQFDQHVAMKQLPLHIDLQQKQPPFSVSNGSKSAGTSHNPTPRSKRRKNHLKKVCHVAAENLSSDVWSWRKYGQKPIKGSPYPRGYYRCSTSKGCMARKQVERNRSDPAMFIVTYTSEHNHPMPTHRNSLAGSTRQKPLDSTTPSGADENAPKASPEMSPALEKLDSSRDDLPEIEDDDGDDFSVTNMALDDDFFAGLEDFTSPKKEEEGDCSISGHFPASVEFPWLSNSVTTTTAGGC